MTFEAIIYEGLCKRLEGMFVPLLNQGVVFRIIIHEIIQASALKEVTIHKIEIFEVADMQYQVKINHNIELQFFIKNESISCKPTS